MMEVMSDIPDRAAWTFELSGGRLCLDFVNTVGGMRGVRPNEHLLGYADLVEFARQSGAIPEDRGRRLLAEARRRPLDAAAILARAVALREELYRVFLARARGERPAAADLAAIGAAMGEALAHRTLEPAGSCCALGWDPDPRALDAPLWPIVLSASELLVSDDALSRVRVCGMYEEEECSWLFMDETRARTKRWCSMQSCGNRAKARRHYARTRRGDA
jgi:predicted RNA-binding Zn ribbon-like protein